MSVHRFTVRFKRQTDEVAYVSVDAENEEQAVELADEELATSDIEWEIVDSSTPDVDEVRQD